MKGGLGDLGEHIFIGYKFTPDFDIIIIVPKSHNKNLHDSDSGLFNNLYYGSPFDKPDESIKSFVVFLPYLNKLTNYFDVRINIYDLVRQGMTFFDIKNGEFVIILSPYIRPGLDYSVSFREGYEDLFKLMGECIYYKKEYYYFSEGDDNRDTYFFNYNKKREEVISIINLDNRFKEAIQDLEYRYQGIIEPILLTDEVSVYNYANGAEPSVAERTDRTARVLEEGMKRI